jgi:hypothetical protein
MRKKEMAMITIEYRKELFRILNSKKAPTNFFHLTQRTQMREIMRINIFKWTITVRERKTKKKKTIKGL